MNTWELLTSVKNPLNLSFTILFHMFKQCLPTVILNWYSIFYLVRLHITYKYEVLPSTLPVEIGFYVDHVLLWLIRQNVSYFPH